MNFSCKKLCVGQLVKDRIDQIVLYRIINLIHGCLSNLIVYMYKRVYALSHASRNAPPNNQLVPHIFRKNACEAFREKKNHVNNQRFVPGGENCREENWERKKLGAPLAPGAIGRWAGLGRVLNNIQAMFG